MRGNRGGACGSSSLDGDLGFFRRALGLDGNGLRGRNGVFRGCRRFRSSFGRGLYLDGARAVGGFLVIGVFLEVEAFLSNANELMGLFRVLRKDGNAMIHCYAESKMENMNN